MDLVNNAKCFKEEIHGTQVVVSLGPKKCYNYTALSIRKLNFLRNANHLNAIAQNIAIAMPTMEDAN